MGKENRGLLDMISPQLRAVLLEKGQTIDLKKGSIVFSDKEEASFFILLQGYMALQRTSRMDDTRILFICGKGEAVNELVRENGLSGIEGVALSNVTVLSIDNNLINELTLQYPEFGEAMYYSLARKTRRLYHQLGNDFSTYQVNNHLAVKIWKLARDYGVATPEGVQIPFDISVVMLAQMLGTKRETVSRAVSKLREGGIVEMENGSLVVKDMEMLRDIVRDGHNSTRMCTLDCAK